MVKSCLFCGWAFFRLFLGKQKCFGQNPSETSCNFPRVHPTQTASHETPPPSNLSKQMPMVCEVSHSKPQMPPDIPTDVQDEPAELCFQFVFLELRNGFRHTWQTRTMNLKVKPEGSARFLESTWESSRTTVCPSGFSQPPVPEFSCSRPERSCESLTSLRRSCTVSSCWPKSSWP